MLKFIFAVVLFAVIVITLLKYVRKDSETFVDEPQDEVETQEFPPLDETVQVPPQEEVVKKECFSLNGETYEVFTSEGGSKYIIRLRVRDNRPYRQYLDASEKEKTFMA